MTRVVVMAILMVMLMLMVPMTVAMAEAKTNTEYEGQCCHDDGEGYANSHGDAADGDIDAAAADGDDAA
eukprot:11573246-Alexandrium_andersonii.AAC.1